MSWVREADIWISEASEQAGEAPAASEITTL